MATIKEQLTHEGFRDKEAAEIFQRAAHLQNQAEQLAERMSRELLEDSAAAAGIRRAFIEQAIEQLQEERTEQAARRAARRRAGSAVAIFVVVILAVAAYNHTARGFPVFLLRPVLGFPRQHVYFHVSEEAKQGPTF